MANKRTAKKVKTENQIQYAKQIKRIKAIIRDLKKKGWEVPADLIPSKPQRITKQHIEELRRLNPTRIKNRSVHLVGVDSQGNKIFETAKEYRQREKAYNEARKKAAQKSASVSQKEKDKAKEQAKADFEKDHDKAPDDQQKTWTYNAAQLIIQQFLSVLLHYPKHAYPVVKAWFDDLIYNFGEDAVAMMILNGQQSGLILTREIAYDKEKLKQYMLDMMAFLNLDEESQAYVEDQIDMDTYFEYDEFSTVKNQNPYV